MKKIKIGLDFHGVISEHYDFFRDFSSSALSKGHEIHIITGGPRGDVERMLEKNGIRYTRLYAMYDYYENAGKLTKMPDGTFRVPDEDWDNGKSKYCEENDIDIHIDDSLKYGDGFKTFFCHYDKNTKKCYIKNGISLDLSKSPKELLADIENLFR